MFLLLRVCFCEYVQSKLMSLPPVGLQTSFLQYVSVPFSLLSPDSTWSLAVSQCPRTGQLAASSPALALRRSRRAASAPAALPLPARSSVRPACEPSLWTLRLNVVKFPLFKGKFCSLLNFLLSLVTTSILFASLSSALITAVECWSAGWTWGPSGQGSCSGCCGARSRLCDRHGCRHSAVRGSGARPYFVVAGVHLASTSTVTLSLGPPTLVLSWAVRCPLVTQTQRDLQCSP